jgi:hypothetical protein
MSEHGEVVEHDAKEKEKKHVKVTLVWGGTGASKSANVELTATAGEVFNEVYALFNQKPTDQDTFELNDQPFDKSKFGTTIATLIKTVGDKLVFEVIPPTSGA